MVVTEIQPSKNSDKKIRLAAYCRVSSDSSDQLNSFATQIKYYTDYSKIHTEYELVDIYADEGISGTSMKKRDEFKRLIKDCEKHKIDCIITKSISRFARNTSDLLTVLRMLKALGVRVYFEEQALDSEKMNAELFVTLPSLAAQQESQNISDNMRWSYRKRMESGAFNTTYPAFGYRLSNNELIVNEDEAKTVRTIFALYLQGMGKQAIANTLNENQIPSRKGKWHCFTVDYVLNNERYMGDALLQKTYTTEALPFARKKNKGECAKYYIENSNVAIISKETFNAVKELQKRRSVQHLTNSYPLSKIIKCSECGHNYRRIVINNKAYWGCSYKASLKTDCTTQTLLETDIYDAYITMMSKLKRYKSEILDNMISQLEYIENISNPNQATISAIDKQIADLSSQNIMVARLRTRGILSESEYSKQTLEINSKISKLRSDRKVLLNDDSAEETISNLKHLSEIIDKFDYREQFNEEIFSDTVELIKADYDHKLVFTLTGGLELTEIIR